MKLPRIYLTHHVDLDVAVSVQDGPGPTDRLVYDRALLEEVRKLSGDDPVEVSKPLNGQKTTFRFSGGSRSLENVLRRYEENKAA